MDMEMAKWLSGLGVGGALAGFIFAAYRKDVRVYTDLWKGQTEMLVQVVKENTAAVAALTVKIMESERREDRREERRASQSH
jgi:hypothetical protein